MRKYLGAAALAVTAALAVPTVASAHPSVYQSLAKIGAARTDEVRYVVTNHGYTVLLKESNTVTGTKGVVAYNLIPSAWRTGKTFADVMAAGGTGAQAHATCVGAAVLETEAAIRSWQDTDAFFNYVPFQTASAGLEDDPANWLPTLQSAGVNTAALATVEGSTAACTALGGVYAAADATQSSVAALAEGPTKPLQAEIKTLKDQGTSLTTELNAAKTQLSAMLLAATPIKLTIASAKGKTVAASGAKVGVAGQPLKPVTVTVSISSAKAKKLKLASTLLGKTTATTAANGTATVTVKVSKAAAKALKRLKGSLSTTVQATSGDRFATATGKLTR